MEENSQWELAHEQPKDKQAFSFYLDVYFPSPLWKINFFNKTKPLADIYNSHKYTVLFLLPVTHERTKNHQAVLHGSNCFWCAVSS